MLCRGALLDLGRALDPSILFKSLNVSLAGNPFLMSERNNFLGQLVKRCSQVFRKGTAVGFGNSL